MNESFATELFAALFCVAEKRLDPSVPPSVFKCPSLDLGSHPIYVLDTLTRRGLVG
jgi:hypothetical protein